MQFRYVENYPDEGPVIEVRSIEGLDNSDTTALEELLKQKVELILFFIGTLHLSILINC